MLTMIKRLLKLSGKYKTGILIGIIFNILKTFCMAFMIFAIFIVADNLDSLTPDIILKALLILIGSVLGRILFQWLMDISMSSKGFDMFRDYRLNVGEKLRKAPMGYFSEQHLGTIQTVMTSTVIELEQYSMLAIIDLTGGIFMTLVMTIMFLFYSPLFSLLTIIGVTAGMIVLNVIQKTAKMHTPKIQAAQENLTTQSLEYIRGISVLRSFLRDDGSEAAVYEAFERKRNADFEQERAGAGLFKAYPMVYKLTGCVFMFLAAALFIAGSIPLSYCLLLIVCAFIVYAEMEQMSDGAFLARKITIELDRLEAVTNTPKIDTSSKELNPKNLDIELKNVSFSYDSRLIIDNVSLKVPEGTTCAIVGPSGSGKTTLCNLIARFWDVQEGQVLLGGQDIKNYTADSLLKYISMVFQNVYLFNDTIENNIKFGNPDASGEQIIEAAKRAQCHEFISSLPDGYSTVVGEGGSTLSGGEKQRISIARAILKNAPIIILDEATSSVDPENEHQLLMAIKELTKGKTLISIAHRLTTVKDADQILVIDEGKITQKGTHDELININGIYMRFWKQRAEAVGWSL
ncbi:MAG: ABC transporter ATP-binding protein [Oscillospiraceae bacterium]|jgi:ATP-binding cassette subfamily B protein